MSSTTKPAAQLSDVIRLTKAEIQSGYDRQAWAEGLIQQLPANHDGRNSWLLNYGRAYTARMFRERRSLPADLDAQSQAVNPPAQAEWAGDPEAKALLSKQDEINSRRAAELVASLKTRLAQATKDLDEATDAGLILADQLTRTQKSLDAVQEARSMDLKFVGVSEQVLRTALNQLWTMLGAQHQTEATIALRELQAKTASK